MTKRRDLIKLLVSHGFLSKGGTKHEKFTDGKRMVLVKRQREIPDEIVEKIKKQAGIK